MILRHPTTTHFPYTTLFRSYDERYCDEHRGVTNKIYDRRRDKQYKDFYNSTAWRKVRYQAMLRDEWLCVMCLDGGIYKQAIIGDHIIPVRQRSEEHTSELQSRGHLVCRLLLEKKKA